MNLQQIGITLLFLFFTLTLAQAQVTKTPIASGDWQNTSIWPGGVLPNLNERVIIPDDISLTLTGTCNAKSILVNGTLTNAGNNDLQLNTEYLLVEGFEAFFSIGTRANPYTGNAVITLIGQPNGQNFNGHGNKYIANRGGGSIEVVGTDKVSWTRLSKSLYPGESVVNLVDQVNWEVGDELFIASSNLDQNEAERFTISSITNNGSTLTIDRPCAYEHHSSIQTYHNGKTGLSHRSWEVNMQSEVGLLSRNIVIEGDASSDQTFFGGHIMSMASSPIYFEGVELRRMGQIRDIARYPFHWHLNGPVSEEEGIHNCSVHDTYNRAIVVHGTSYASVEDNVIFNVWGSALFIEDGIETFNSIKRNLISNVYVPPHAPEDRDFDSNTLPGGIDNPLGIVPSDYQIHLFRVQSPAAVWITNPNNIIEDNVVAGCEGVGYWFGLPEEPTGLSAGAIIPSPRNTPILSFKGNKAHSVHSGLHFDHSHDAAQEHLVDAPYLPEVNGEPVWTDVTDFTCYKMNRGWWTRTAVTEKGHNILFKDIKLLDCEDEEMIISSWVGKMEDCLFVGRSINNSLPERQGFTAAMAFYDGGYQVYDSHFQDFDLPYLSVFAWFGGAADLSNDYFQNCTFDNVNVYNDYDVHKSVSLAGVTRDVSGDLTGIPGSIILPEHPFLVDDNQFSKFDQNQIGWFSNSPMYACKLDFAKENNNDKNSMYCEWGDGHMVHSSVWGASNQFTVIPNIGRNYAFRWLDDIHGAIPVTFKYAKNGDVFDFSLEGSQLPLSLVGISASSSLSALQVKQENGYYWDSSSRILYIRMIADGDLTPDNENYTASATVTIASGSFQNATQTYAREKRPYQGVTHQTNQIIEAEHFDYGGQFKAYLEMGDQAPNPLSDVSSESNRFTASTVIHDKVRHGELVETYYDFSYASNAFYIRDIYAGEYWNYTISIPQSQSYEIEIKTRSDSPTQQFELTTDTGYNQTFTIQSNGTGWQTYKIPIGYINAGEYVFRLRALTSDNNIDWFAINTPGNTMDDLTGDVDGDGKPSNEESGLGRNGDSPCDMGWEFDLDNLEEWWNATGLDTSYVEHGLLNLTTNNFDPSLNSPYLTLDGSQVKNLQVRYKANRAGLVELFWENENGSFNLDRRLEAKYTFPGSWQILTFPVSLSDEWNGKTIYNIRMDWHIESGVTCQVDWIRGSCEDLENTSGDEDGDGKPYYEELILGRDHLDVCDLGFEFNNDSREGWVGFVGLTDPIIANGSLQTTSTNNDPSMNSPKLSVDAFKIRQVQVRMKAALNGAAELFWRSENESFGFDKRLDVLYTGNGDWQTITFDVFKDSNWSGTIDFLRFDPINQGGAIEIDWIRGNCTIAHAVTGDQDGDGKNYITELQEQRNPSTICDMGWEFNLASDETQWIFGNNVSNIGIQGGALVADSDNSDPQMISPLLSIDGDSIEFIRVEMRAFQNGVVELFWANENGSFSANRRLEANYQGGGAWRNVDFYLNNHPEWQGEQISRIRIDPISASTTFYIESIKGYCCFNPSSCSNYGTLVDNDLDGFPAGVDCNDSSAEINPNAPEIPNNFVDENCDGIEAIIDNDLDGFINTEDCDDFDDTIFPDAEEIPNNPFDENCDGVLEYIDEDGDGFINEEDCNDSDASINPAAMEVPYNAIDENCDGILTGWDEDGDGYPLPDDCDDLDNSVYPGSPEICDAKDNNCNGTIDEGISGTLYFADQDGDGFGNEDLTQSFCFTPAEGFVLQAGDCNDNNPSINPFAMEIPGNTVDENCDGDLGEIDNDNDGFPIGEDCDDTNPNIFPGATELCDEVDNDCDGLIDEDLPLSTYYADADNDGFGNATMTITDCDQPEGYVGNGDDCDDTNPDINPQALEIPGNTIDENCDGEFGLVDNDNDGFDTSEDCDDNNVSVYPGAVEVCDDIDNNCDGQIDEGLLMTYYVDADMDGYGDPNNFGEFCLLPPGSADNGLDCDDTNSTIYPEAEEICDGLDNNCDGQIDEGIPVFTIYQDQDGDGFGDDESSITSCSLMSGFAIIGGDCNDFNADINPDAIEIPNNGIDENCDGLDTTTSLVEIDDAKISIFPNPATDMLYINSDYKISKVELLGMSSLQIINIEEVEALILDIHNLPTGIYLVRVNFEEAISPYHTKLIVLD